ncbi:uncharacterized protein OCT59_007055 [Rhizophagus irregularis]|uniref:uncharacterized protein n=1 Tax=Rhizophagus irregularis TaxID=588596 RepID=UPI00331AB43C|nr:hypothetical protein OCT59_007055 [Rhizophagus irregularis]
MVLEYAEHGSLRNYLGKSYDKLGWEDKLNDLCWIALGPARVHGKELIHRDLHNAPYHDVSHDESLAIKICLGLRPRFNIEVPQLIVHLIKRCLDENPLKRPTADEIANILCSWYVEFNSQMELKQKIKESKEINNKILGDSSISSTSSPLSYKTHSRAIYTSRLINFNNLPESKNSDDYYNLYDDIISKEYSSN